MIIIENSLSGIGLYRKVLSSDNLRMTDAERAPPILKEKELQSKGNVVAEIDSKEPGGTAEIIPL